MAADAKTVMELRERTGAGVMDCKAALQASEGNLDAAVEFLRKKGLADAKKRESRDAKDGLVHAYIHPGAKLGVLIEVNCETDFVAKTDAFRGLVRDLAMQVAASNPVYVARADVPVPVSLQSDNITQVTIYRVGALGAFEQRSLELVPGSYTVVGTRPGYRDVRREISVMPGAAPAPIVIRCEDKI